MPGTVPVQLECRVSVDMLCRQAAEPIRARSRRLRCLLRAFGGSA